MLKFVNDAATVLVTGAERIVAPVRGAMNRREERVVLARLMDSDEHLLNDIGLTRDDVAVMMRRNGASLTPTSWSADPLRAVSAQF